MFVVRFYNQTSMITLYINATGMRDIIMVQSMPRDKQGFYKIKKKLQSLFEKYLSSTLTLLVSVGYSRYILCNILQWRHIKVCNYSSQNLKTCKMPEFDIISYDDLSVPQGKWQRPYTIIKISSLYRKPLLQIWMQSISFLIFL